MASIIYNSFKQKLGDGSIDLDADSFSLRLMSSEYTPNKTHVNVSNLSGEVIGTGYTAGGKALTNVTWTASGESMVLDADNLSWTNATFTARYGVLVDETAVGDPLVACFDFLENKAVTGGTFNLNMNSAGILVLS